MRIFTFTGHAGEPGRDQSKPVGYDLVPIATTLWAEALRGINPTYAETEDYRTLRLDFAEGGTTSREATIEIGRIRSAFRGKVGGENLSRPLWAWFDGKDRDQPLGQWFFDPARSIRRNFQLDAATFSTAYVSGWPVALDSDN